MVRKEWKQLHLDGDGCLNLEVILSSFSAPITEQHVWAIVFQAMRSLMCTLNDNPEEIFLTKLPEQILITQTGDVHANTFLKPGHDRIKVRSTARCVADLALQMYDALDYNLPTEEERQLSQELGNLIDFMTSVLEEDEEGEDGEDEGIDEDVEELDVLLVNKVLQQCRHHLAVEQEAEEHYRGVCRAMVLEAMELSSFMSRVTSSNPADKQLQNELREIDMADWASLWTSVMHQLRTGVRLKKVEYSRTPNEYAMSPYEMIMDDIRAKRYKLNHVELKEKLKKDAREVILDFIRSRPPLRPAFARQLPPLRKESTPGELLMQDLRGSKARQSLRRTQHPKIVNSKTVEEREDLKEVKEEKAEKKVIDLDESLLKDMLDFEDNSSNTSTDDIITPDPSPNGKSPSLLRKSANLDVATTPTVVDGRMNASVGDVFTPAMVIDDVTPTVRSSNRLNVPRNSEYRSASTGRKPKMTLSNLSDSKTLENGSTPILSPLATSSKDNSQYFSSTVRGSRDWEFVNSLHSLDLTILELAHIRSQITKAELEDKIMGREKLKDLEKGRVCFVCEKTRFGVFNWASYCTICNKYVCSKCTTRIKLPSDQLKDIPVSILTNQLLAIDQTDADASLIRRMSNQLGITPATPQPQEAGRKPRLSPSPSPGGAALVRQQTSPDLKSSTPVARPALSRSNWNRSSMRNHPIQRGAVLNQNPKTTLTTGSPRPKLVRSKTMGRSELEVVKSLKLNQPGVMHPVCTNCRDLLSCIVRTKLETEKLCKIKTKLASFREEF